MSISPLLAKLSLEISLRTNKSTGSNKAYQGQMGKLKAHAFRLTLLSIRRHMLTMHGQGHGEKVC